MADFLSTVDDYRQIARRKLPRMVFDYVEGGASSERGLVRNVEAFARRQLAPRRLVDVSLRDQVVRPFGLDWASPFAVAPMGLTGVVRPSGDLMLARAAHRAGIPFCISTASTSTVEEVADVSGGELWFQLYVVERQLAVELVRRAEAAGCTTLVLTVDVVVNGERVRDKRSGFGVPFKYSPKIVWEGAIHPIWALRQLRHGFPELAHFASAGSGDVAAQSALMGRQMDASFDWEALSALRDRWKGKLLVKGVLRADDAARCEKLGVDGLVLSNHGGRQLEDVPAPIDVISQVRRVTSIPLLLDSGVRSGADVIKAMATGASGVLLGRPLLYGLAAAGEDGADAIIALLKQQVDNVLALIGCPAARDVDGGFLTPDDR